jgi:hypothetical protein
MQIQLVEAHMARLQFEMGQTLRPRAALTRSFIALDQAVLMVAQAVTRHTRLPASPQSASAVLTSPRPPVSFCCGSARPVAF